MYGLSVYLQILCAIHHSQKSATVQYSGIKFAKGDDNVVAECHSDIALTDNSGDWMASLYRINFNVICVISSRTDDKGYQCGSDSFLETVNTRFLFLNDSKCPQCRLNH